MPNLGISASVTAYGREMILRCQEVIEREYPGSVTIYGDTDSVMVKFAGVTDMATAIERGKQAADLLTAQFKPPIRLEFEKVFFPYLLMGTLWGGAAHAVQSVARVPQTRQRTNSPSCRCMSNMPPHNCRVHTRVSHPRDRCR